MDRIDRKWLSVCGLRCATCTIHLRTEDELAYWRTRNVDPEKIRCNGCRSARDEHHWSNDCEILACCIDMKGHAYCSECSEFPCRMLERWAEGMEHHAQAVARLREMRALGTEAWLRAHNYR